jgi:hypothetical protein
MGQDSLLYPRPVQNFLRIFSKRVTRRTFIIPPKSLYEAAIWGDLLSLTLT